MKILAVILTVALLLGGMAFAEETKAEKPPVLTLERDGIVERPAFGNYSWSWPTGNGDEWTGIEACGMAPTDPMVPSVFDHILIFEETEYTLCWDGTPPDELIVFSWDSAVFGDQEHIDDYQKNPEIILRSGEGKITLKPDRVYDFQAKWTEDKGSLQPYGNANYYIVTEQLVMLDGPDSIRVGGWEPSADPAVTEELQAVFEKGMSTLTGTSLTPVAYLGSQLVAGRNHAFLCQVGTAYPGTLDADPAYAIAYLYEDLQGNVSILNIEDFDIGSLCTYGAEAE